MDQVFELLGENKDLTNIVANYLDQDELNYYSKKWDEIKDWQKLVVKINDDKLLKYKLNNCTNNKEIDIAIQEFARSNHIEGLMLIYKKKGISYHNFNEIIYHASVSGNIHILQWIRMIKPFAISAINENIIIKLIEVNAVPAIKYLLKRSAISASTLGSMIKFQNLRHNTSKQLVLDHMYGK